MEKFVKITFPNKERFLVPASVIAKARTDYYAIHVDGHEAGSKEWQEEYNHSISDDYEITDWLANNMDWVDIKEHAVKLEEDEGYDYDKGFFEAETEVVEE